MNKFEKWLTKDTAVISQCDYIISLIGDEINFLFLQDKNGNDYYCLEPSKYFIKYIEVNFEPELDKDFEDKTYRLGFGKLQEVYDAFKLQKSRRKAIDNFILDNPN